LGDSWKKESKELQSASISFGTASNKAIPASIFPILDSIWTLKNSPH
jgi:hypothetical protein